MTAIIRFFVTNHIVSNLIVLLVMVGGVYAWFEIRKEELPDFDFDMVSITTNYPGASPGEVEQAITLPLEHELADLENIRRITSYSKRGISTIVLELERGMKNTDLSVMEIQSRIQVVKLPLEVEEPPLVRHRKTSQKAVIDVCLYFTDKLLLNDEDRRSLQSHMRNLENRLLMRNQISSLDRDAYLEEEIHVKPKIADLFRYQITLKELRESILSHHTDLPLGIMETPVREQVRLNGRLERPELFDALPVRSSFVGHTVKLGDVAQTNWAFQDTTTLVRINGHEGVIFNVVKSSQTGILEAVEVVNEEVQNYLLASQNSGLSIKLLDDESFGVRNRLSIISGNVLIGFILIIFIITFFLDIRTAVWIMLGIPFSFLFTLLLAWLMDYTVNNITLAGVIIAMGMLVDDAIVVSENIARLRASGKDLLSASIEGTSEVLGPIFASILTTIAAFLPLLAFEGRIALLATTIPPIVALILTGSLIESMIILPGHLSLDTSIISRLWNRLPFSKSGRIKPAVQQANWFARYERLYASLLITLLKRRGMVFLFFAITTISGYLLFENFMHFSLFPREQVSTMFVIGEAPKKFNRYQTLQLSEPIENFFLPMVNKQVNGIRTTVGYRRYRPSDEENVVSVRVELNEEVLDKEKTNSIVSQTRKFLDSVEGFAKLRLSTQMFGSDSGSAIEIMVQENNDAIRQSTAEELVKKLAAMDDTGYVELDQSASDFEYKLTPLRTVMNRFEIDPGEVERTLRSALSGLLLYTFYDENEEKGVRLRFDKSYRSNIDKVMQIPASNKTGFQVPLKQLIATQRIHTISEIQRVNQRRVLRVNADIKANRKITPLEMAEKLERTVFRDLKKKYPSVNFEFDGEIKNTRESSSFFQSAVVIVLLLIYSILAIQFNSLLRPFVVMIAILPAWVSVVYVFLLHGISVYGFFAVVGVLGLSGIVVNGSILLLDRIEKDFQNTDSLLNVFEQIANSSATRLRAVFLTTTTTVAGLLPTAYGVAGYDSMLAEMMLVIAWGLVLSMSVTLVLVPAIISIEYQLRLKR